MAHEAALPAQTVFSLLRNQAQAAAQLVVRETDVDTAEGPVCHALDLDGRPLVLVPLGPHSAVPEDVSGRGVSLRRRVLLQQGLERVFVAVRCEDAELDRQFAIFADDLVAVLGASDSPPEADTVEVLDKWRSLFEKVPAAQLGPNVIAGLLGELHLLEALAIRDPQHALLWWRGWDRARHDFQSDAVAVEVKTTTGRNQFLVEVSGIWQLEPPRGSSLFLLAEQVERVATGGDSVPDALERVIRAGVPSAALYANLSQLGYHGGDSEAYRHFRFARLQARLCAVQDDFPKIVRDSFADPARADGIIGLKYSVDVGVYPESAADPVEQAATLLLSGTAEDIQP